MGAERRSRVVRGCVRPVNQVPAWGSRVNELKSPGKPFEASKRAAWEAWEKVKASRSGVAPCHTHSSRYAKQCVQITV